jgi:signal transduction histidine kinase
MRLKGYFHGLRFKITVGIALPLILILGVFSYLQYIRQRDLLLANLDRATTNIGTIIVGSLMQAMLTQDLPEVQGILNNISKQSEVRHVFVMDNRSVVGFAPDDQTLGTEYTLTSPGCVECHAPDLPVHPFSIVYTTAQGERMFRNCTPIQNQPECYRCHGSTNRYNGVLITDLSMQSVDKSLADDLRAYILWSLAAILATIVTLNALMSRMVITKLERLAEVLKHFSRGDLSQRVHWRSDDEIGELAASFNRMADGLSEKARLEEQVHQHSQELERLNDELRRKETLRGQLLDKLINAQEEERKRIARDLHDQLGVTLSGLTLGIEAFGQSLPDAPRLAPERWQRLKALATRALEETHQLIFDLRPVALDELGLVAAIRADAEQRLQPCGVEVQVSTTGTRRRLPAQLELTLFRIVQEAVSNIARHAHARHIRLTFEFLDAAVRVTVEDDGEGFDVSAVSPTGNETRGLGLLGMIERAQLSGGALQLGSQVGRGTRIVVTMPAPSEKR